LILDKQACGKKNIKHVLECALKGGVDLVQYRDKISPSRTMIQQTKTLLKITRRFNVPLIINDRWDVFLETEADGIHMGQKDLPIAYTEETLGKDKIVGLSCHCAVDIKSAQHAKIDYLGFGPVFKTATKPEARPVGLSALNYALKNSTHPVFALGGITLKNLKKIFWVHQPRIAVCREICQATNITRAAKRLKESLKNV